MEALADAYVSGAGVPQDMEKASAWYRQAIELGSGKAANALGVLYQSSDAAASLAWFEKAAAMNDPDGARNAGQAYARRGNWQDGAKAVYYLQKAADLGRAIALHDLGLLYEEGRAVRPDAVRARQFYEQAVQRRVRDSVARLADMYLQGRGIPKDESKGLDVLRGAAEGGDRDSAFTLASYYEKGLYVPADQQQQRYWLERAASLGKSGVYVPLANLYAAGLGGPKDEARATQILKQGAERGDAEAAIALVIRFEKGDGEEDERQAVRYTRLAAKLGHLAAQCGLASRLLTGRGVDKDESQAAELISRSAAARAPCGEHLLGSMYMRGAGVPLDQVKGIQLTRSASDKGYPPALFDLGRYYESGVGVTKDLSLSRTYLEAAKAKGYPMAGVSLDNLPPSGHGAAKAPPIWPSGSAEALPTWPSMQAANPHWADRGGTFGGGGNPKSIVALGATNARQQLAERTDKWRNAAPPRLDYRPDAQSAPEAAFSLGMQYLFGSKSVARDDARAASYFRQAAEGGSAAAQHNLGIMYFKGQGVAKDGREAAKWLQKAADQNFVPALTLLAGMYGTGQGVPKDPMTALALRARIPPDQRKTKDGVEPSVVLSGGEMSKFSLGMRRGGFEIKREAVSGPTPSLPPSPAPAPRESEDSVGR